MAVSKIVPDLILLGRVRERDAAAFDALYGCYHAALRHCEAIRLGVSEVVCFR